jgi:hypothetical protein
MGMPLLYFHPIGTDRVSRPGPAKQVTDCLVSARHEGSPDHPDIEVFPMASADRLGA